MFRPGAQEFLKKMSTLYEIVIFTASVEAYAIPLMNKLDPERLSTAILWREH
jgi:RNA polymerase II subunit A small phosphatase-like protein